MSLRDRYRDHGLRELLEFIIETQERIVAAQDDINAAVTALNALVAEIQANPAVDTSALNAAVTAADAVLPPAAPAAPAVDENGNPVAA